MIPVALNAERLLLKTVVALKDHRHLDVEPRQ